MSDRDMSADALDLCETSVKVAERLGATEAEAVARRVRQIGVEVERSAIKSSSGGDALQLSVRAYVGKAMGLAFTTAWEGGEVERLVGRAISLAKSSQPDPNFVSIPSPGPYPSVEGLYDAELVNLEPPKLIEMVLEGVSTAKSGPRVDVFGGGGLSVEEEAIANSHGIRVVEKATGIFGELDCKISEGDDLGTGGDYFAVRNLSGADFMKIGSEALGKAERNLGSRKVESGDYSIVLDHRTTGRTLSSIVGFGADAYNVMLGTSYFKDRLNEAVSPELISLRDNPLHRAGIASGICDAEGTPRQVTPIVEKGVLASFYSDSYTANRLKIENTGNASRPDLRSKPHPGLTNTQIGAGDASIEEIIRETRKGIYVYDSGFGPMAGTTNVSSMIDYGFRIENGELKHSVKNTMMGTTVFDLLKNIDMVSKELLDESGRISPSMRILTAKIASGL